MDDKGLKAPFPWFGGKRRVAAEVWRRFGPVKNYVEPFFGSGAVLLGRPDEPKIETVNDLDGFVANFWRSVQSAPDEVAKYADAPVNENDLHAKHAWLVRQRDTLRERLEGDHEWYDAKIAGFWVWGVSCWIGSGFCSGNGPWAPNEEGLLVKGDNGPGVNRQLPHLSNAGQGVNGTSMALVEWLNALSDRLRRVRVCSGDWSRVCGPSVTFGHGLTGVFLDPPYADTAKRQEGLYRQDSQSVAHDVRVWAIESGENPLMRIALCGYEGEHEMPKTWSVYSWSAHGGFSLQSKTENKNRHKERIWFSPACLNGEAINGR